MLMAELLFFFGLGKYYVIPRSHSTGAVARAGGQKGQSIEGDLSKQLWKLQVAGRAWVESWSAGRSLLQLDPRLFLGAVLALTAVGYLSLSSNTCHIRVR
jgi:hypothetical protein